MEPESEKNSSKQLTHHNLTSPKLARDCDESNGSDVYLKYVRNVSDYNKVPTDSGLDRHTDKWTEIKRPESSQRRNVNK